MEENRKKMGRLGRAAQEALQGLAANNKRFPLVNEYKNGGKRVAYFVSQSEIWVMLSLPRRRLPLPVGSEEFKKVHKKAMAEWHEIISLAQHGDSPRLSDKVLAFRENTKINNRNVAEYEKQRLKKGKEEMSFEAIRSETGQPRAKIICDDCGKIDTVPCEHNRHKAAAPTVNEGHAAKKAQQKGWSYIGKRLRCPDCEAARKATGSTVTPIKKPAPAPAPVAAAPAAEKPTREQKRIIMEMVAECYDTRLMRYRRGDTDAIIASAIGPEIRVEWVTEIRDEFFGPAGVNEDMTALTETLTELSTKAEDVSEGIAALKGAIDKAGKDAMAAMEAVNRLTNDLANKEAEGRALVREINHAKAQLRDVVASVSGEGSEFLKALEAEAKAAGK